MTFTRVNDTDDLPVDPCRRPTGVVAVWNCRCHADARLRTRAYLFVRAVPAPKSRGGVKEVQRGCTLQGRFVRLSNRKKISVQLQDHVQQ